MSNIGLSSKELNIVNDAWKSIAAKLPGAKLILFGSLAKNQGRENSDIDLAIKATNKVPLNLLAEFEDLLEESELVRCVDILDYQRLNKYMQVHIDSQGVFLY
ncbi:MAG: nucleotidyltransferase domain-containing protein [Deltaproteobacteria bacterium]|nr:nucleotidyltransferase domain-containing protein [Deltaproteobacteria bacterium]